MRIIIMLSAIALISATQKPPPSRSVNVALETSFLFDPKDLDGNKSFVNNIRSFLDKLHKILEPTPSDKQNFRAETKQREPEEDEKFSDFFDFVKNVGKHFVNMTATKIKGTVNSVEDTNNADVRRAKDQEAQPEGDMKNFVKVSINEWVQSNPEEIRILMNTTLTADNPLMKTFARRMNNYYNDDELKKLNKNFKKIRRYMDSGRDTTKMVDDLIHSAIFQKYSSLNETSKAALKGDLTMLSDFLSANNMFNGLSRTLTVLTRRKSEGQGNGDTTELHDDTDLTYNSLKSSIEKNLKAARDKNDDKTKGATNELVVDNVELFVEPSPK